MTFEGSVAKYLYSHAKRKTCRIPDIYEYHVPQNSKSVSCVQNDNLAARFQNP